MKARLLAGLLILFSLRTFGQCSLNVSISSSAQAICSGNMVVITANATSGTPPYKYLWNTGETTQSINVNKAGTFSVTVTDNNSACKGVTQSISLANSTTPATPTAADVSTCPNTSATLTATAPGGFYQWYDAPSGGNLVGTGASYTTPVLVSGRTYYVETTINSCTSLRKAVNANVINVVSVAGATVCQGNTATLYAGAADSYKWYDASTGGNLVSSTSSYTTPPLMQTTVYYVVGTANGCTSNRTPVTAYVVAAPQSPVVAGASICSGSAVNLSAAAQAGVVFDWFAVPNGGTSLITSPDYTTPPLTATTTYYVQASANGCVSPRSAITVTVNAIPPAPAANNVTICPGNSAVLSVTGDGSTHQWFRSAGSQAVLTTGDTYQTPALTKSTTYYVRTINGSCVSSRTAVNVTVNPFLPPPSAGSRVVCTGNSAALSATAQQGTVEWYDAAAGGNLLSTSFTYNTPALTADVTYYVQAVQAGCSSQRVAVQVSVQPLPQAPLASGQTICAGNTATLTAASSATGYQWYDAATAGNLLSSNQTFTTPALTATTTYYVAAVSAAGCVSTRTAVTVTVTPYPASPSANGTTICPGTQATLMASSNGGAISWFDAAAGGTQLAAGNTFTTPQLTANTTYYVQSTVGQCSSTRTAVTVTVTQLPDPQFGYSSGTYCSSGPNPTPTIYTPGGGTFSASPAGLVFISTTTGQINLSASTLGEYVISFTGNGPCPKTGTTRVTITALPLSQFVYNGPYCQKTANPSPTFIPGASGGVFTATPSGLFFTGTPGQIDLAKSQAGMYTVTNTIPALGSCPSSTFTSTVTIEQAAAVDAGPDQTVAAGVTVQLAGSFSGASGVTWSGGAGVFSNKNSPTSTYTPATGETSVVLTLTTSDPPGVCGPQSASVTITFSGTLATPTVANASVCPGTPATLQATAPGGTYQWYDAATGGNLLYTGDTFTTPALSVTTVYYVQTTLNVVTSARTQVTVTVNNVSAPVVPASATCSGSTATLTASGSAGTYQWYDAAAGGNLLSVKNTFTTPLLVTSTTYYVETTAGGCTSPRTAATVTVNPVPSITSADGISACNNTPINYTITSDVASAAFTWSRAAVANVSNAAVSGQTAPVINEALVNTGSAPVDVTYVIIPSASGCTGLAFNLVVTVYPAVTVTSAATQTVCDRVSPDYAIKFSSPPDSFNWSRAAVSGISNSAVNNQAAPVIRELLNNTTNKPIDVNYAFTIYSPSCAAVTFNYVVTVNPYDYVTSGNNTVLCSGTAQNYTMQAFVAQSTFVWRRPATGGIDNAAVDNQTSNTITETLVNTTDHNINAYYYIVPYFNGCAGSQFTYIATVKPQPVTPVINSNSPVCLNSTIKFNTTTITGATYMWTGPNGFSSSAQNPVIANVTKANAGTYSLIVINNSNCSSPAAFADVAVDDPPVSNAGADQTVCNNVTQVNLNGMISGGTTTGIWTTSGTGTFSPANNQLNAQYIPSDQDKASGSVRLTLTSTSKDDCTIASSGITITFQTAPTANAGGNRDVCTQDVSISLNGSAQNNTSVVWTTSGTGTFSPSANVDKPLYIQSKADIQSGAVTLTFQAFGTYCNSTVDNAVIRFVPPPTVSAGKDRYVLKGQTTTLTSSVSDANVQYLWTPNKYLNDNTAANPIATGFEDITYNLKVTDSRGCITEDQVMLKILDVITIPNTFTPNGDSKNDTWSIPALNKYPGATVEVYTRDGKQVFHSDGYGIPWDGTYEGRLLPVGVYYYIINTRFQDINKLSGYVTIIR